MVDKNIKYLSVKEAAEYTGKSESTIKRLVRSEKGNSKFFKFEKLPTGHQKIYISKAYLQQSFVKNDPLVNKKNDRLKVKVKNTVDQSFVAYLLKEVERQNEQLKEKDQKIYELMENQIQNTAKILQIQDQAQKLQAVASQSLLEESTSKKRWWQRGK